MRFRSFEKPRYRIAHAEDHAEVFHGIAISLCYFRAGVIYSLPLVRGLLALFLFRKLILRSYAPDAHIGENVVIAGFLHDPDLTRIGNHVVLGADCVLAAHSWASRRPGESTYSSAPIVIDDGVSVGGQTRIGMGVTIGANSIIEPASYVVPFTTVPSGEVWGENPAVFLRKRLGEIGLESPPLIVDRNGMTHASTRGDANTRDAARRLIASTLNLPLDRVDDRLSAANCSEWDSMGQFAIASALYDGHGCRVPPDEIFRIRSVANVERIMGQELRPSGIDDAAEPLPKDPELLPLLDHELVTRILAQRELGAPGSRQAPRQLIVIASSFTAEPLASSLKLWSRAFGIEAEVEFCGFNQIPQALLSPESPFKRDSTSLNVVLTRPEDLPISPESRVEAIDSLIGSIGRFQQESLGGSTLVVGTLPPPLSSSHTSDRTDIDLLRAEWRSRLAQMEGVELFDFSAIIESVGTDAASDAALESLTRAPYSARVYQELGIGLSRLVRRRCVPRAKVVALDCDGVLWGGVVAEDGIDGIQVGSDGPGRAFQWFQRALLELKRRGVLLVLVSRNEEADVFRVFDHHPGMVLRRADLAAWRINWNPKSEGLRELADELNLGLDSFVFIDDDPVQRLEVEARFPQVTVFPTPTDPARYSEMLSKLWTFDAAKTTSEDSARTEMIHQERERRDHLQRNTDLRSYLRDLGLVVELRSATKHDLPRVAQLTQKTNQFNLSLNRRTLEEIRALDGRHQIFVVSASDRFGDYGLVGTCIIRHEHETDPTLVIDTFLLSCRALGRGVEQAFLHGIFAAARSRQMQRIRAPFVEGPRNQPARRFFSENGFDESENGLFAVGAPFDLPLPEHVVLKFEEATSIVSTSADPSIP